MSTDGTAWGKDFARHAGKVAKHVAEFAGRAAFVARDVAVIKAAGDAASSMADACRSMMHAGHEIGAAWRRSGERLA